MADKIVNRANLQDVRKQCSEYATENSDRIDVIAEFLKLDPNTLGFDIGADPEWIVADGNVPITLSGSLGLNPPTIVGDAIRINSPGFYEVSALFGIDIDSGGNTVVIEIYVNGAPTTAVKAGVEFSGGQSAPIVQPNAYYLSHYDVGDLITFVATELGTGTKTILWNLSGGTCIQTVYDFEQLIPST